MPASRQHHHGTRITALTITMPLDGYVAGRNQSEDDRLGEGGMALHEWFFPLKELREMRREQGGETNASSARTARLRTA